VGYPPASGVRLVFRDAAGREMTSLSTAAPKGPPQTPQPRSGGIVVFSYPASKSNRAGVTMAYLIDGQVGFWSRIWGLYIAPVPVANGPAADGIVLDFGWPSDVSRKNPYPSLVKAFGYARTEVARVVVHLPGGAQAVASTFAAWPGSGIRLWAVSVPVHLQYAGHAFTITCYDAAGHVVQTDALGQIG
jgi:hypothetical protein